MKILVGALVCWICVILAGFLLFSERYVVAFDPTLTLTEKMTRPDFDALFTAQLNQRGINAGTVVHFYSDETCYCERLSQPHQQTLAAHPKLAAYKFVPMKIDDDNVFSVPSTPAVAVLDHNNQLRYLGPYAVGFGCFEDENLVDLIASVTTLEYYHGGVINADNEGCFCR